VMGLYLVLSRSLSDGSTQPALTGLGLIGSLAFWPLDLFQDGFPRPYYTLGWTLHYEMLFYCLFALCIANTRGITVLRVGLILLIGTIMGAVFQPPMSPLGFWMQPIVLEFGLGMLIAQAWLRGVRFPAWLGLVLIMVALSALIFDGLGSGMKPETWITPNDGARLLSWGMPSALLMAACVLTRWPINGGNPSLFTRFWAGLGDASYALYLIHPFAVVATRKIWLMLNLQTSLGLWAMVASMLIASVIAAFMLHYGVEKPITNALRARFEPKKA
jgi:exopolysaccharide production protein ExoZ